MKWIEYEKKRPKNQQECIVAFCIIPEDDSCGYCFNMATYCKGKFLSWELGKELDNITH